MRIVIAGGGLAGQRCAEALRRSGHDGPLTMVCAEPHLPYDRPPLSKELLAGERDVASLSFRDGAWYRDHDVDLLLGVRATGLRRGRLETSAGLVPFDRLLAATGARPRTLPGLDGAHTLRDAGDALRLAPHLRPGRHVVIVGAGFIGLEVASTAARLGARVTVVEAGPAPLAAILGAEMGGWFTGLHRRAGVEVVTNARADVTRMGADAILVAVGVTPAVEWLEPGVPDVFLAGDAAGHHHWEAAVRGGQAAARAMLGLPAAPGQPSSFWSDQQGVRIQLVGSPSGADRVTIDGDRDAADFSATWWLGAQPVAVLLVGRPGALPDARRLVAGAAPPERKVA